MRGREGDFAIVRRVLLRLFLALVLIRLVCLLCFRLYLLHLLIKGACKALLFLIYQDVYSALAERFECVGKD